MKKIFAFATILGLVGVLGSVTAMGQTTSIWINAAGGDWATAANWNPASAPDSGNIVADFSTLSLSSDIVVAQNANISIRSLIYGDQNATPHTLTLGNTGNSLTIGASGESFIKVANGRFQVNNRLLAASGSTGLVKLGGGTLLFGYSGGWNGYGSGGLTLREGTIEYAYNGGNSFAHSQGVLFDGGRLHYTFGALGVNQSGTFTVNSGTLSLTGGTADYRFNGVNQLRGSGSLRVDGGGVFWITAAQNLYQGTLDLQELATTLRSTANLTNTTVHLGSGARFRPENNLIIGRLTGTGGVYPWSSSRTLTVGDDGPSPFSFDGTVSGAISLVKAGTSEMTLSGTNTYTGTTTINAGKLTLNGSHSGGGAYAVKANAILAGNGTISGASAGITVNSNGTIAAGNSIGPFTVADLTLKTGAQAAFEIDGVDVAGVDYDQIRGGAGRTLTLEDGWVLQLAFGQVAPGDHTIKLFDFDTYSGSFGPDIVVTSGDAFDITYNPASGELSFTSPIPEPSTLLLTGLSLLTMALARRKTLNRSGT